MMGKNRSILRTLSVQCIVAFLKVCAPLWFDKRYLVGRHFSETRAGWAWVLRSLFTQKLAGFGRDVPWPVSPFIRIADYRGILFHIDDLNNFQTFGLYFSNNNGGIIEIGKGTYIAPNVGIITTNHDVKNPDLHVKPRNVHIGSNCWIGMNSVILPGVILGDHTVVGAGSVVTKSFADGYCIVAGNPATKLHDISDVEMPKATSSNHQRY